MHPEIEELRPKLKEILYDCAVEVRATKAALYLFDGTSRFELVTEYGFRGTARPWADMNSPLIDKSSRARTPFFINGVGADPKFSELLFESATDKLLGAPIFSRGKLVGVIDMRDKAGKQQFEQEDVPKAQAIADKIVESFGTRNLFGHHYIELSAVLSGHRTLTAEPEPVTSMPGPAAAQRAPQSPPQPPVVSPAPAVEPAPRLANLVLDARTASAHIAAQQPPPSLTESDFAAAREVLRSILAIPGAVAATFTAYGHLGGMQEIVSRSTIADDAKNVMQSKLNVWLAKRGDTAGHVRTSVTTPFGTDAPQITASHVQKVFTAAVAVGAMRGLYLTVAFASNPDRTAHEFLRIMHSHLQVVLEQSSNRGALESLRSKIAAKLLEPDFSSYPELRRHTEAVAELTVSFARHLGLAPAQVETARLVALVHDVGMRLLDYQRLYRKRDLTPEEMGFLREHPYVSAGIVEPLLGAEVGRAVLCHHERVDGRGYPEGLTGEEIPLLSRVVQICDAWVAMTDSNTYQKPEPLESALATMTRSAGNQFDADLAARFVEMMSVTR